MSNYKIEKLRNKIEFSNNSIIYFEDEKIHDFLELNNVLIIIVKFCQIRNSNVYGIDTIKQKKIWQIDNPRKDDFCYFTNGIIKNDKLFLRSLCNFSVEVNEQTGEIIKVTQLNEFK